MGIEEDVETNSVQADIAEPLINSNEEGSKGSEWMVYFSTIIAVWGSYEFGCCAGYSSPTQTAITEDLDLTLAEYSVVGSILTIGAMIGAITSGSIADYIGRKGAMRTAVAFCVVGWLAIFFAEGAVALDIGRLCTGYGMGVFSYVVPVFIAEIAPKNLRGRLTTLNQLMIVTGVSVSFLIGNFVAWRILALIGLIPCLIQIVGLFLIPESPRWLAKIGRQKEFEVALRRLRGKDADITSEATEIQDYIETLEKLPKAKILDLFQRRYLRSVMIGVGLMVCQQFGGINGVCFYLSQIFISAGKDYQVYVNLMLRIRDSWNAIIILAASIMYVNVVQAHVVPNQQKDRSTFRQCVQQVGSYKNGRQSNRNLFLENRRWMNCRLFSH